MKFKHLLDILLSIAFGFLLGLGLIVAGYLLGGILCQLY